MFFFILVMRQNAKECCQSVDLSNSLFQSKIGQQILASMPSRTVWRWLNIARNQKKKNGCISMKFVEDIHGCKVDSFLWPLNWQCCSKVVFSQLWNALLEYFYTQQENISNMPLWFIFHFYRSFGAWYSLSIYPLSTTYPDLSKGLYFYLMHIPLALVCLCEGAVQNRVW